MPNANIEQGMHYSIIPMWSRQYQQVADVVAQLRQAFPPESNSGLLVVAAAHGIDPGEASSDSVLGSEFNLTKKRARNPLQRVEPHTVSDSFNPTEVRPEYYLLIILPIDSPISLALPVINLAGELATRYLMDEVLERHA